MSNLKPIFALRWMSLDLNNDESTLVQVMVWCHQATNHYLSQCWPRSMLPYGVTRPQWVDNINRYHQGQVNEWMSQIHRQVLQTHLLVYPASSRVPHVDLASSPLVACSFVSVKWVVLPARSWNASMLLYAQYPALPDHLKNIINFFLSNHKKHHSK